MASHSVFCHPGLDSIVAWRNGQAVTLQRCLNDARQVAAMLAPGRHMLNLCTNRYHFMVGFVAALLQNKISILQPTCTAETSRRLLNYAPDLFCLTDRTDKTPDLPIVDFPSLNASGMQTEEIPAVESQRHVATIFTSGSAGTPVPHHKNWGSLVRNIRAEALRLALKEQTVIVSTVPPQHMYGFESTVLLAMLGGFALCAEQAFYPADIRTAIERLPCPRLLVSTPFHLRTLMKSGVSIPEIEQVISATAPLSIDLARTIENLSTAPLIEIYGCTETGQLASRRPTLSELWTTFSGVSLHQHNGLVYAEGGHLDTVTALDDHLQLLDTTHFMLLGRSGDTLNIAGKRTSLAYLNQQLNSLPGVEDGVFLIPESERCDSITRPAALIVAPTLDKTTVLNQLRERIDPIFLPRPLLLVDSLPRNETGKLPAQALVALQLRLREAGRQELTATVMKQCESVDTHPAIADHHPAYNGHFPNNPVFPGALLLDHIILAIESTLEPNFRVTQISAAKFISPLRPGEHITLHHERKDALINFSLSVNDRIIAKGQVHIEQWQADIPFLHHEQPPS
ncbi:AMP-binding protein [Candidatus Methylospira mobilis]|uniref:AMP-binding protein n=1 Tax=Candidatus Methylospira mobilis TaxID=1808979 RepID=UPI0028EB2710|nr:AMP-binding protein [Candidatus Methylospira mobilis]WNV04926.1 AMP-binding protein [Candidatus Methylospira mobilis]